MAMNIIWLAIGVQPYGCDKYQPVIIGHIKHSPMTRGSLSIIITTNHIIEPNG